MEELERKANVQLERQLVMASDWSRTLLTMRGKLKGTEWDPENSHRINFSDFMKLLDSNSVQYMEYSNYGQTISGSKSRKVYSFSAFLLVTHANEMDLLNCGSISEKVRSFRGFSVNDIIALSSDFSVFQSD